MASEAFKSQIEDVILYKFGQSALEYASNKNSINILSQVIELNLFESIFSPVITGELVVQDAIGLFTNFPISGEEIVYISVRAHDNSIRNELMVIEAITDIGVSDDNRTSTYIIRVVSIEQWANARRGVQKAYNGISSDAVKNIFQEFITAPLEGLLPSGYTTKPFFTRSVDETAKLWVIPNLKPFAAINMVADHAEPISKDFYTFFFYQNGNGYHYETVQDMFGGLRTTAARREAKRNAYRYISDEIEASPRMSNQNRIITSLNYNKRHSSLQKMVMGYFQNKFFEINLAQKNFYITEWKTDDISIQLEKNKLNTQEYRKLLAPISDSEEQANRIRYSVTTQPEYNLSFPVSKMRERWGRDLIEKLALSQIDITVSLPGNPSLQAGELFYLEVADAHGFNKNEEDDLVSGYFLISEKRDMLTQDGKYVTSLRLQKDSYNTTIDKNSTYRFDQEYS